MANRTPLFNSGQPWQSASALRLVKAEPKFPALSLPLLNGLFHNGLQRGSITEVSGQRSCGKTSVCLHVLAEATGQGEICAVVDAYGSFHPESAADAGVDLSRLLWIRCNGNSGHALRAADLLLHAGGFSVVCLDLCDVPVRVLNQIPLSYWYRFGRAIENTPTTLLLCNTFPQAKCSTAQNLELKNQEVHWSGERPAVLLSGIDTLGGYARTLRSSTQRLTLRTAV
ncbi:MAG: hypothetical protein ACJ746_23325 [Bryobacteraceae bacterium]